MFNSGKCVEVLSEFLFHYLTDMVSVLKDWHEVWLKDGFWHILFSVLLLFIMIIWRPSNNIARFAS